MKITVSLLASPLTTPILDGTVGVEGVDVTPLAAKSVDDNSRRMLDGAFDVAEMSLATFVRAMERQVPLIGLPVFLGRRFVQSGILRSRTAKIEKPADLVGRQVAVPQYWLTSSVWHRGVLRHEYGVDPASFDWVTAVPERGAARFPDGVRVTYREGTTVSELLAKGEVDAVLMPRPLTPQMAEAGCACIFRDLVGAQRDYLSRTGIYPIMHFVVLRAELLERMPKLNIAFHRAFERAKVLAFGAGGKRTIESPIDGMAVDEALELFGGDPWPYGLPRNHAALDAFLTYALEQGLVRERPALDRLFLPFAGLEGGLAA